MTIQLPEHLFLYVREQVRAGRFPSENEVISDALERHRRAEPTTSAPEPFPDDSDDQALQRRLFEAGVIREIKPPITDLAAYQNRHAVPIQGEPISESAIRERR